MKSDVPKPTASPAELLAPDRPLTLANVADGAEGLVIADLARAVAARKSPPATSALVICRDGQRMAALARALAFFAPNIEAMQFPAWDCQPYDRVSPHAAIVAQRMTALSRLARVTGRERPLVLLATVNAVLQRVPARETVAKQALSAAPGNVLPMAGIQQWLELNGYVRASTVREPGDYAVRGGILDLFPPGMDLPVRLDFFGDTLETIRSFDPETQRTAMDMRGLDLVPVSEFQLTSDTIRKFRTGYVAAFGAADRDDMLYEAVSEGRRYPGMEHWLPLFHDRLETLFDYLPGTPVVLEHLDDEAAGERLSQIADYYQARKDALAEDGGSPYKPLPPDRLYLAEAEWKERLRTAQLARLSPFAVPDADGVLDVGARTGRNFAAERADEKANVFDAVVRHVRALQGQGKRVAVALWSEGSRERMRHVLADHGLDRICPVADWPAAQACKPDEVALAVLGLETGFETDTAAVIGEQDILGDRLVRPRRASKRAENFIAEATSLSTGDLVVHVDHGIGRFTGLATIQAAGAPHDCLEIHYAGESKLYLPVENIELLSRYGSEDTGVELDRLGGTGWQTRKAKLKNRIREIAHELIKVAAARKTREAPRMTLTPGAYDEFAAGFPYEETEDQQAAIDATLEDLAAGRPMDRLVCGDVGFGKTEVALRAAFDAVMNGKQVAVVVPTTLLARQHAKTFTERFRGFPVQVGQASRMVGSAELARVKKGLANGGIDIVVGTHALLGKSVKFKDLGLVIVDEEQHFGVSHKEKLKTLRAEVHVLTLTATPIPRTLQLALTGVRDLSIIASPPVDRLAVRTFVSPLDPLIVREAILRERYRGGQVFYVCPRIEDLAGRKEFLDKTVPEARVAVAHGQMPPTVLEDIMSAFYEGRFDVLLSTTIVESGLDIPTANTLIVHRADMFGLAQLYQLRGRVGRSKVRAYALFTLPAEKKITAQAERRLKVLQSLDTLGAGFQLASHDLDIRGAGNLLGDEQSGHVAAVGFELYCQMIDEAVAEAAAAQGEGEERVEVPEPVRLDVPVDAYLPASFVPFEAAKIDVHRRIVAAREPGQLRAIRDELADRFGPLPDQAENLLKLQQARIELGLAGARSVEFRGGKLSVTGVELDSEAAGILSEQVEGALYEWREQTAALRVAGDPDERLAAVLDLANGLREAQRQTEAAAA